MFLFLFDQINESESESESARLPQQPKNYKISTILVYGHVDILWTYQEAKIQF